MNQNNPINEPEVLKTLNLFFQDRKVIELRILKTGFKGKQTHAGYFDSAASLLSSLKKGKYESYYGIYITLNPISESLLSRYNNRIESNIVSTTANADIIKRTWLYIDIDPVRPSNIASSDHEHQEALDIAELISTELNMDYSFPVPIVADSGNGASLLYRIELNNNDESKQLIIDVLQAIADKYNSGTICIDQTVFNAGRIIKLFGTLSKKGDDTKERPYRYSKILSIPDKIEQLNADTMKTLIPTEVTGQIKFKEISTTDIFFSSKAFDMAGWIEKYKLPLMEVKQSNNTTIYKLRECPFESSHTNGQAAIITDKRSGVLAFKCMHESCRLKKWQDVRKKYEPEYAKKKMTMNNEYLKVLLSKEQNLN